MKLLKVLAKVLTVFKGLGFGWFVMAATLFVAKGYNVGFIILGLVSLLLYIISTITINDIKNYLN